MGTRAMRWVVCAVCFVVGINSSRADDRLRGLSSVHVHVSLDGAYKTIGLTEQTYRTAVELRLRQSGMAVNSKDANYSDEDGLLSLSVFITPVAPGGTIMGYAYHCNLYLMDCVTLCRHPTKKTLATTWNHGGAGYAGVATVRDAIRKRVRDLADEFCNAYLAANPKGQSAKGKGGDVPPPCKRLEYPDELVAKTVYAYWLNKPTVSLEQALANGKNFCDETYEVEQNRADCVACHEALIQEAYAESP